MSNVNDATILLSISNEDLLNNYSSSLLDTFKQQFDDKLLLQMTADIYNVDNILTNPPPDACEACKGRGVYNNEVCWHCEGERVDPLM